MFKNTALQRDIESYVLKKDIPDERLRAVYLKALRAIGCSEREFKRLDASSCSALAKRMKERKNIEQSRPNQERGR